MTVKTRAAIKAENASDFPDNARRLITAAHLRGQMDDISDSYFLAEDLGTPTGPASAANVSAAISALVTQVVSIAGTTHTLSSANHNKIVDCTNAAGCTVTVPPALTSGTSGTPFTCGISKGEGAGDVTVSGATVKAPNDNLTMVDEYGLMTLTQWPDSSFRLYGGTA